MVVGRGIIRKRTRDSNNRNSYFRFLSPENPLDDIGGKAFKIRDVFNCFKNRTEVIKHKNYRRG